MSRVKENKLKYFLFVGIIFSLSSCLNEKHVFSGNKVLFIKPGGPTGGGFPPALSNDSLFVYKIVKGFKAKVKENDGYLTIKPSGSDVALNKIDSLELKPPTDGPTAIAWWLKVNQVKGANLFFPNIIPGKSPETFQINTIKYFDSKPVLQTLTIPIRIRPKLNSPALKDSFPSQIETGVNVGIAFGWKFNYHCYKPTVGAFGQKGNTLSFTPALFYGLGAASLTKANTRNPVITFERKALSHTLGIIDMIGFNSINLGYAIGWDFATGTGSSSWLYQGRLWQGIAFSLDLIK